MRRLNSLIAAAGAALLAGCETAPWAGSTARDDGYPAPHADRRLDAITWPSMERFESEGDFRRYIARTRSEAERRGLWWWAGADESVAYASLKATAPCDPKLGNCDEDGGERIVVTGSRIAAPPFTNTQEAGVDEGDIVKQIGDHLVVLQDGRLFSVDMRPNGEDGLVLAARKDVYRSSDEDTWYDEMLVFDRRIVVTGYSYDENATEFSVLTLGDDGGFTRDAVFYMTSDDYYDVDNYATRIVGDQLVIHTPIFISGLAPYEPAPWPTIRRWREEGEDGRRPDDRGRELFDARDIYKPLQRTLQPTLHTVSVCPLSASIEEGEFVCRSTALIGSEGYAFYVSETDAWLWVHVGYDEGGELFAEDVDCKAASRADFESGAPSVLYRVPLNGRGPEALGVRGAPLDQFGLDADEDEFRALLLQWPFDPCIEEMGDQQLAYFSTPVQRLDATLRDAPDDAYAIVPSTGGRSFENRFTDRHLVYAGRDGRGSRAPGDKDLGQEARLVAIPIGAPESPTVLTAPHGVIRLEQAGAYAIATGYRDPRGLSVSVVDLRGEPRIADTAILSGRFETEGRSHAFNSRIEPDGSGVMGVPTAVSRRESGRWSWRSEQSDVSFLAVGADARLAPAGELQMNVKSQDPTYECEVSCVDWYGNSRPIFTNGRVFALSGTEIIEGVLTGGRIEEVRRADLTEPAPMTVAASPERD